MRTPDIVPKCIGLTHRALGHSKIGLWLAIKLRNQVSAVIGAHLNDGIDLQENGEQLLIRHVAPTATCFVDVGANTGAWTAEFIRKMKTRGRGLLFEPSPTATEILHKRLQAFGHAADGIEIIQSAVSDTAGVGAFYMEANAGETSSFIAEHSQSSSTKINVNITTLDIELQKHQIDYVDMLKIDAEGYDLNVIRGAAESIARRAIGMIQFEYNYPWVYAGNTLAEAIRRFESNGYLVYLLKKQGLFEFEYDRYGEFLRYSNFVAIAPQSVSIVDSVLAGQI